MLHFPSKLSSSTTSNGTSTPKRTDSLNATQHKAVTGSQHPMFLKIEEELHDARRVQADGQEDDLRGALGMVIARVGKLTNLLSEAYKEQADLEVQLNVAKSNLKLVIANNEMLEDALKQNFSSSKDVGWRRTSGREGASHHPSQSSGSAHDPRASIERSQSVDVVALSHNQNHNDTSPPPSAGTPTSSSTQDNRFFKFRFNSSSSSATAPASASTSRPGTPAGAHGPGGGGPGGGIGGAHAAHLTSPSMPSLTMGKSKELEELEKELEKERVEKKKIADEKAALEAEIESLSQALFEEANNMVATERKMRAETEEELKEVKQEKEALRSALKLIEGENTDLRSRSLNASLMGSPNPNISAPEQGQGIPASIYENMGMRDDASSGSVGGGGGMTRSRSSSRVAVKSRPGSLDLEGHTGLPPLPPSPAPGGGYDTVYGGEKTPSSSSSLSSSVSASARLKGPKSHSRSQSHSLTLPLSPHGDAEGEIEESHPTPRNVPLSMGVQDDILMSSSAWADVPSRSASPAVGARVGGKRISG